MGDCLDFARKKGSRNKLKKMTPNEAKVAALRFRQREVKAGRMRKGIFEK